MRPALTFCLCLAALLATSTARADVTWVPGNSREIARTDSASRDTPVSALVFTPRVRAMGAADFAIAKISWSGFALRPGVDAFFELEHADTGLSGALPLPGQGNGPMLWRGFYRMSLALSAESLGRRWFGPRGAFEIVVSAGHESDHVTGASFSDAPNRGDILAGGGGDFLIYELAVRRGVGPKVDVWARAEDRAYVRGAIFHAPGLDLGLRWHWQPHLEPVLSLFGEGLLVNHNLNGANDGYFASALAGLSVKGALGQVMPFVTTDVGNGKGFLINRHELRVSLGVRYAPF